MSDDTYTFHLSYTTEKSLEIEVIDMDDGLLWAMVRHPMGARLENSWYYGDAMGWHNWTGDEYKSCFFGRTVRELLDCISDHMWYGSVAVSYDRDMRYWFRQHLYIAFALGSLPSPDVSTIVVDEPSTMW